MTHRTSQVARKTAETDIKLSLDLDFDGGNPAAATVISTGIEFFDHMLRSLSTHAGFGLILTCAGDLGVDCHHTVEDVGIAFGQAIKTALGERRGIVRFASVAVPMDEALSTCAIDISGRGYLVFDAEFHRQFCGEYDTAMTEEFMRALATNAGITLHVKSEYGVNDHHKTESLYKALARALRAAVRVEGTIIPSTKGSL